MRAKVPPQFQPKSESGELPGKFREVSDVDRAARAFDDRIRFLAQENDTAETIGVRAPSGKSESPRDRKRKDREEEAKRFAARMAKEALDARIAELEAQIAAIDARLEEIENRQDEITEQNSAIDELLELIEDGELDANDPAHIELLRRAGLRPEDAGRGDLAILLAQQRATLGRESGDLANESTLLLRQRGELEREHGEALELRDRMDNDPDSIEQIVQENSASELGRDRLNTAAGEMESTDGRIQVVDAMELDEATDRQARDSIGDDFFGPSAAAQVSPTPIQAAPLTPAFAAAADPNASHPEVPEQTAELESAIAPKLPGLNG